MFLENSLPGGSFSLPLSHWFLTWQHIITWFYSKKTWKGVRVRLLLCAVIQGQHRHCCCWCDHGLLDPQLPTRPVGGRGAFPQSPVIRLPPLLPGRFFILSTISLKNDKQKEAKQTCKFHTCFFTIQFLEWEGNRILDLVVPNFYLCENQCVVAAMPQQHRGEMAHIICGPHAVFLSSQNVEFFYQDQRTLNIFTSGTGTSQLFLWKTGY